MRLLILFILALLFIVGGNIYSYKRFISKISFLKPYLKFIKFIFFIFTPFQVLFFLEVRFDILNYYVYIFSGILVAFSWFLLAVSVIYDTLYVLLKRTNFNQNRRKFLKFCFDITFVILFFSYFLKGIFTAVKPPKINNVSIKLKNLKTPLKIALISDIHIGEVLQKEFLQNLVNIINEQKPDIVTIIGDLVDTNVFGIGGNLDPLKELKAPTFFVLGNHEYYHGAGAIMDKISSLGVKVLKNENTQIFGINLAGVYDMAGFRFDEYLPDLSMALIGIDENLPTILLSHQPKFIKTMQKDVDLVLCGHTHGGQIFPFHILVKMDQGYLYGLYKHNDKMQVYVSSGAGFWGPAVRIFAPSEIAILNLKG